MRSRRRVGRIVARDDQRGNLHRQQLLGLGSRRRLAVEEGPRARGDDAEIPIDVLTLELPGEALVAHDRGSPRSEEHTSELQSRLHLVCRLLLEKKKTDIPLRNGAW